MYACIYVLCMYVCMYICMYTYIICIYVPLSSRPSVHPSIRPSVHPSVRPSKSFPLLVDLFEAAWRDTTLKLFLIDYLGVKSVGLGGSREILSWGKLRFSSTKLRRDMCIFGSISVNFGRTIILDAGLTGQSSVLNRLRVVLKQLEYQKSDIQQKWSWNWLKLAPKWQKWAISVNFGRTIILDAGLTGQSSVPNR